MIVCTVCMQEKKLQKPPEQREHTPEHVKSKISWGHALTQWALYLPSSPPFPSLALHQMLGNQMKQI